MPTDPGDRPGRAAGRWRIAAWAAAALALLLPLVAMQLSDTVRWDPADFVLLAGMLLAAGGTLELAVRTTGNRAYRSAVAVALAAGWLLVWANGAVGLVGSEDNAANRMVPGVLAVAVAGTLLARFRPAGMAVAMLATALAQIAVAVIAAIAGWGQAWMETGFFVVLWLVSAGLFRRSAAGLGPPARRPAG